jgi:hypothetical protein
MVDAAQINQIKEAMEVKSSDGKHVGTVDSVEGKHIKVVAGWTYKYIDAGIVDAVRDGVVRLSKTAEETRQRWR